MKIINLNTKHIFNLPKKAADELLSDPSGEFAAVSKKNKCTKNKKTEMIKKEDNLNNLILSEILDE